MNIINADVEVIDVTPNALKKIEQVARTCYKSESKISDDEESARALVARLVRSRHDAMLEHVSATVKFIVDRGVSHEIVRHRVASFAQESTRYCNYAADKFGEELTFIKPSYLDSHSAQYQMWQTCMKRCEKTYLSMIDAGCKPEEARAVLPTSIKTELIMTANLREWRHFFMLRAVGVTGKPHPQMKEIALAALYRLDEEIDVVFDDIFEMLFEQQSKENKSND